MALNINSLDYISEDVADKVSTPLLLELRSMAHGALWPAYIVSSLTIDYEDGELVINYPEDMEEAVDNLEYGDINSLPNAVLRPFSYRAPFLLKQVIEQDSLGALFLELGVL